MRLSSLSSEAEVPRARYDSIFSTLRATIPRRFQTIPVAAVSLLRRLKNIEYVPSAGEQFEGFLNKELRES